MPHRLQENDRRRLLAGFSRFLSEEGLIGLGNEDRESVEIALQCLDNVFDTSSVPASEIPDIKVCLQTQGQKDQSKTFEGPANNKQEAEKLKAEGNRHLSSGRHDEAISCYQSAINLDPQNSILHSNLAAAQIALGDYEAAVESSQRAVDLDPGYAKAWSRMGTALHQLGRHDKAIEAFQEALCLDPNNENAKQTLKTLQPPSPTPASNMADMMGGMDINKIMSDPNFRQMANQMMQSGAFNELLKDPSAVQELMKGSFGAGGKKRQ